MTKLCVGIVFGGRSVEHEVSLQSAKNIIDSIDRNRFEIVLLSIDKQGKWYLSDINNYLINENNLRKIKLISSKNRIAVLPGQDKKKLINFRNAKRLKKIDVIFPIVHGQLGEDGSMQGMLRMLGFPFVGSDILSSAICMDKDITKRLLRDAGIKIAPFVTLTRKNYNNYSFDDLIARFGLPLIIKPANQGSSFGVSKVRTKEQFINAVNLSFKISNKIIIETNIKGREIECAVLGNSPPKASSCGEIVLDNHFYSYNEKYFSKNNQQLIIPASLSSEISNMIREISISVYQILECRSMARIDIFLTSNNEVIVNEINTLPGFGNTSMYPKLWEVSGISYSSLISQLIDLALE